MRHRGIGIPLYQSICELLDVELDRAVTKKQHCQFHLFQLLWRSFSSIRQTPNPVFHIGSATDFGSFGRDQLRVLTPN